MCGQFHNSKKSLKTSKQFYSIALAPSLTKFFKIVLHIVLRHELGVFLLYLPTSDKKWTDIFFFHLSLRFYVRYIFFCYFCLLPVSNYTHTKVNTNIHARGGIRTRNPLDQASRVRPCLYALSHPDRLYSYTVMKNTDLIRPTLVTRLTFFFFTHFYVRRR